MEYLIAVCVYTNMIYKNNVVHGFESYQKTECWVVIAVRLI